MGYRQIENAFQATVGTVAQLQVAAVQPGNALDNGQAQSSTGGVAAGSFQSREGLLEAFHVSFRDAAAPVQHCQLDVFPRLAGGQDEGGCTVFHGVIQKIDQGPFQGPGA